MTRILRPARAAGAALALIALATCSRGGGGAPTKLLIGATLPLTGAEARIGGFFKEGYDLAVEQVNQRGGVQVGQAKLPVTLTLLDDTSTQATAVSLADRLINNDKVDFLLGTYASHLVQAQSAIAEQNKIPYVNGGGGATDIYRRGYKYLFGIIAPVELLGTTLMRWIDEEQKAGKLPRPARIALLWENTAHGKDFRKGVSDFAAKSGAYQIAVDESFELNGKDFGALLGKVKAAGVDLFLVDAHLPDYITMHRQYVAAGLCHKVVTYGARGAEKDAIQALGPENTAYVLSGVWWSPQLAAKPGLSRDFVAAFKAKYGGREPEWFQALAYESARVLFTAIQQAGKVDREAVREKLQATSMPSLLPGGTAELKAQFGNQVQNPFVVQQNQKDGTAPIIFPKDAATGTGTGANPKCAK